MYNEKIKIDKLRVFSFKLIKNSRIKPIINKIEIDFIIISTVFSLKLLANTVLKILPPSSPPSGNILYINKSRLITANVSLKRKKQNKLAIGPAISIKIFLRLLRYPFWTMLMPPGINKISFGFDDRRHISSKCAASWINAAK